MWVGSLGQEDPLEEGTATHSILAWRIPWPTQPSRLQSMGSHSWTGLKQLSIHTYSLLDTVNNLMKTRFILMLTVPISHMKN